MATSGTSSKALQGIKVLDLTQYEAGTTVTQALAWFGADVVKVEEPTQGDQGRFSNTNIPGIDSHYFMMLNCNKRSVTLNLRSERGKGLLRSMIPKADIFIENFAPGTIEKLGFSYEAVSAINPGIIYTQIKGFAPDGPYARFLSFDMIAQAMGGIMSVTGEMDGPPMKVGPSLGDSGAALHCLASILAALYQKSVTGMGQRIDVAMQDTMVSFLRVAFANQYILGEPQPRMGNRFKVGTMITPGNTYHCKPFGPNDYCYIYSSRAHNKHWESLLKTMGREDLLGNPRYSTHAARAEHHEEVDQILAEWARNYTKYEVLQMLGDAGVPVGAVLDTQELLAAQDMRERGVIATINHPVRGKLAVPGWPVRMSGSPVDVVSAPLLGQHSAEVYKEWLGITEEEVAQLREEKVI